MKVQTANDLLDFWQEIYQVLTPKYKEKFLKHPDLKSILSFDSYSIKIAVKRNKKLSDALKELKQDKKKKMGRKGKFGTRPGLGDRFTQY